MTIELIRFMDHNRQLPGVEPMGCFGELLIDGVFQCYTVEQPWRDNRRYVSCIPAGDYFLVPYRSERYGDVVALTNGDSVVASQHEAGPDDRFACLFHAANWSRQLQGCIAPGERITWGQGNLMVTNSRATLADLLPKLVDQVISIRWKHDNYRPQSVGV